MLLNINFITINKNGTAEYFPCFVSSPSHGGITES